MRQLSLKNVLGEKLVLFLTFVAVLFGSVIMCRKYTRNVGISGAGSVVGIATAYGLDGPGIESR